jgi:hypothetical protein
VVAGSRGCCWEQNNCCSRCAISAAITTTKWLANGQSQSCPSANQRTDTSKRTRTADSVGGEQLAAEAATAAAAAAAAAGVAAL